MNVSAVEPSTEDVRADRRRVNAAHKAQRNRRIYELRQQGVSYAQLSRQFGLGRGWLREMCGRMHYRESLPPLALLLSPRAFNILASRFGNDMTILGDPARIVAETNSRQLFCLKAVGGKTVAEIARALETLGYHLE